MIKIDFRPPANDKSWNRWRSDCDKAVKEMEKVIATGQRPTVSDLYKRKGIKERFYFDKTGCFHGKCAYCESYVTEFQHPDVEHYRPKLGVTDETDTPIRVDYGSGPEPHWGYYWLAYSVDNLLPACQICNQPSTVASEKVGKHNRFPVDGGYARNATEIATERPFLINPLMEDPEVEIGINLTDATLYGRNGSKRGEMTIKILGLNVRDLVRKGRLSKIEEVKSLLVQAVHSDDDKRKLEAIKKLQLMKSGDSEYALAVRAVVADRIGPLSALL